MTILAGVHEQYQGTVDATTPVETLRRYPLTAVTREFNSSPIEPQNLVPRLKNLCQEVWDAGLIAAVSFKFSVAGVLNGKWKPYIESASAWLRDSGYQDKTILVIWHEPENDVPKHFDHVEEFVMYFNQVHDWVKGIAPNILTCHSALGYRYADKNKGTKTNPRLEPIDIDDETAKTWGLTRADIKTLDIYSGRTFPLGTILPELTGFKRWLAHTVGTGTYGITERGWMADTPAEYALRASTIKREAEWLRTDLDGQRCRLYIVWLTVGTENDPTLKPDPLMTDAVNYLLERVNEPDPVPEEPTVPVGQPSEPANSVDCPLCNGVGRVAAGQTYTIVKTG